MQSIQNAARQYSESLNDEGKTYAAELMLEYGEKLALYPTKEALRLLQMFYLMFHQSLAPKQKEVV